MDTFTLMNIRMVTNQLTDEELVALYMVATASSDPTPVAGYEKAKSLFTEHDGTQVHSETLAALDVIVGERLAH